MKPNVLSKILGLVAALLSWQLAGIGHAQTRINETNVLVETVAGSGFAGYLDGAGTMTMFNGPSLIAVDRMTNVFVWDLGNRRIRKLSPDGTVTTFAGSGTQSRADGVGTNASFHTPTAMIALPDGSIVIADLGFFRRISPAGEVTTIGGGSGYADGLLADARFDQDLGLTIDEQANIYVADRGNCRIRKISTNGIVTTVAGSGNRDRVDGVGIFSSFFYPAGIARDQFGNLYVAEIGDGATVLRRISSSGVVTTFAGRMPPYAGDGEGTNASVRGHNVVCDSTGNIYAAGVDSIGRISPEAKITTLAGGWGQGFVDGDGQNARFNGANFLAVDPAGRLWVADSVNQRIRRVSYSPVPVTGLGLALYPGLSVTGALGSSFRIEFSDTLTNSPSWTPAITITLSNSPTLWFDTSGARPKRFYRAVLVP